MKRWMIGLMVCLLLCGCAAEQPAVDPAPVVPDPDPVTDPAPDSTLMTEPTRDPDPVPEPPAPAPQPEPEPEPLPVFWDEACTRVRITHTMSTTREWHDFNAKTSEPKFMGVITQSYPFAYTFPEEDLAAWRDALRDPNMERDEEFGKRYEDSEIQVSLYRGSMGQPSLAAMTLYYRNESGSQQRQFYLCQEDGPVYRLSEEASAGLYDLFVGKDLAHIYLDPHLCSSLLECPEIWTVKDPERTMTEQEAAEVLMGALTDSLHLKKDCRSFVIVGGAPEIRVRKYDPELHWTGEHLTQDQWCVDDLSDWEYRGISPERGLFFDECATLEYREGAWYLYTWYLTGQNMGDLPIREVVR